MNTPSITIPTRQSQNIPAQVVPHPMQPVDTPDPARQQELVRETGEKRSSSQGQGETRPRNHSGEHRQKLPGWRVPIALSPARHGGTGVIIRGMLILVIVVGAVIVGGIKVVPSVFHFSSHATPKLTVTAGRRGQVNEFPLPGESTLDQVCSLSCITAGPDGNLWFLGYNSRDGYSWVGRITPAGVITTFPLPPESTPAGIMSGPGGSLWFSEDIISAGDSNGESFPNFHKIGKITPAGVISEFPVPVPAGLTDDTLDGMTSGPDGNLWFDLTINTNETATNSTGRAASPLCEIGRVTPAGVVTEFSVPNIVPAGLIPACALTGITPGPDGNLWFGVTIDEFNKASSSLVSSLCEIGRITPAGIISEFPVPNNYEVSTNLTYDELDNITPGPDGDLWFDLVRTTTSSSGLHYDGGTIGRITPAGVITEFPMLGYLDGVDPGFDPSVGPDMVPSPDGNLWFTDAFFGPDPANGQIRPTYKMGRITSTGGITEFPMPNNDEVQGIRLGPDGNIWCIVTHDGKYQVGHITPTGGITEFPSTTFNLIQGFTFGRDGNLWLTEGVGDNDSGVIVQFLLA